MATTNRPPQNPLLIEEIIHKVFGHLHSSGDLAACYDVCQVWRNLAPPYISKIGLSVLVKGNIMGPEDEHDFESRHDGLYYLSALPDPRKDFLPKATRFILDKADLTCSRLESILQEVGRGLEELELSYPPSYEDMDHPARAGWAGISFDDPNQPPLPPVVAPRKMKTVQDIISPALFRDLLLNKAPFLKHVALTGLPPHVSQKSPFPDYKKLQKDPDRHFHLRKIEFVLHRTWRNNWGYDYPFLMGLFTLSPHLEELTIEGTDGDLSVEAGCEVNILRSLMQTGRLKQIKVLRLDRVDNGMVEFLKEHLKPGQLRVLEAKQLLMPSVCAWPWEDFQNQHSTSLEILEVPDMSGEERPECIALAPMPRLVELRISKYTAMYFSRNAHPFERFDEIQEPELPEPQLQQVEQQEEVQHVPFLDYATNFPNLNLLSLRASSVVSVGFPSLASFWKNYLNFWRIPLIRLTWMTSCCIAMLQRVERLSTVKSYLNYFQEEIIPLEGSAYEHCSSVRVLQEIPCGVDQMLMARIGQYFPNLTIFRTPIPTGYENLLISVWQFCPNITELILVIDADTPDTAATTGDEGNGRHSLSLDSIFSGIPESVCTEFKKREREGQNEEELANMNFGDMRGGRPSILDLKKLRRLCIEGPGRNLRDWSGGTRHDKLTNLCGYSTFTALSQEIVFVQIDDGLNQWSDECMGHIVAYTNLDLCMRFYPETVRLIRRGYGFHTLETHTSTLPLKWYGLKADIGIWSPGEPIVECKLPE